MLKATWEGVLWDTPLPQPADVKTLCQESTQQLESGFETSDNKRKMPYKLLTCKLTPKYPYLAAELEAELPHGTALGLLLVVQS